MTIDLDELEKLVGEKWSRGLHGVNADELLKRLTVENEGYVKAREKLSEAKIELREASRREVAASTVETEKERELKISQARIILLMHALKLS